MAAPSLKNIDKNAVYIWDDTNKKFVAWDGEVVADLPGFDIPDYDYIALTYVAAGNGAGEIETVTYKSGGAGGSTVATLTLAYDVNDKLSTVTKT